MHFISQERYNPQSGSYDKYYRIKESFRDAFGRVHSRVLLNVGFIQGLEPTDIRDIGAGLTFIASNKGCNTLFEDCFPDYSPIVKEHIKKYWSMIIEKGSLDVAQKNLAEIAQKAKRSVDVESIKHTDAQDIGAENLCLQALKQLEFDKFLQKEGWSEKEINTTLAHLIIRAVYSPSELKSHRIMQENSAVGELLTGDKDWTPSLKSIYKCAPSLYKIKDKIEKHLCEKTDNLFNLTNRILLFDLTNFYFEGRKEKSQKSQFGRSKERRSDCKLLVLALCVNTEGFIRY